MGPLSEHYPGLRLERFLKEVEDILQARLFQPLLSLNSDAFQVSPRQRKYLEEDFLKGIPLAYLLGYSEFYGQHFFVNSSVLIPRPETEQLIELVAQFAESKKRQFSRVLDIGTGSGVILLSLLAQEVARIGEGVDISQEALKVAQTNARRLRLSHKSHFYNSDRLTNVKGSFDLVISNPPYIKFSSHRSLVQQSVDKNEPQKALYIADDEYEDWFDQLFYSVKDVLDPGGVFFMEGHELELQHQSRQLKNIGFKASEVFKDFSGRDRFLMASV